MSQHDSDPQHPNDQLHQLLELMCEEALTAQQTRQLESLILGSREARQQYLDYIALHGSLHWDTAQSSYPAPALPADQHLQSRLHRYRFALSAAACVALLVTALLYFNGRNANDVPVANQNIKQGDQRQNQTGQNVADTNVAVTKTGSKTNSSAKTTDVMSSTRLTLPLINHSFSKTEATKPDTNQQTETATRTPPTKQTPDSLQQIVARINQEMEQGWQAADITPSPVADDSEWMRRLYLDVVGHIATVEETEQFLGAADSLKREALLNRLLSDVDYINNWTTIWTNLLVGRSPADTVNRPALQQFLRRSLKENRPWSDIVYDLVAAEGTAEDNGAANFLLAHLNNQAVPATAITARLFLGIQVQCTQCHHHPHNDWTQNQFWELNSFFMQTAVKTTRKNDRKTGKPLPVHALINKPIGGPISFENRQGVMHVAFPIFENKSINSDPETNRRSELAKLMTHSDEPLLAKAFVNRMWSHFFGYAFTNPVDDMGPHNMPTHPELLDYLAREFVLADYDIKQLIRWICLSNAYQLTSRMTDNNSIDQPEIGMAPLFSHMYVKTMSPEQVYDSLLVATQAHYAAQADWNAVAGQRQEWLEQFVLAYQNEENNEELNFAGTIPQALMMMNGPMTASALDAREGTLLHKLITRNTSSQRKLQELALATLNREPTRTEQQAFRDLVASYIKQQHLAKTRQQAEAQALKDIYWAYLNSNEFTLIY